MTRFFLTALTICSALSFIASPAKAETEGFSDAQKVELQKLFEEYLLENGENILKSVNNYQAKLEEDGQKAAKAQAKEFMAALKDKDLPMTGNPDGDITMVEFFDYNCGYCRKALTEIQAVLKDDKNLKVVFMDMPILGPQSLEASKWSLAAHKQGKYFEYHRLILEHNGQKDEAALEKLAKEAGLDIEKLKKDKDSEDVQKMLNENIQSAQLMNIRGTPGFILGDDIYPGYIPAAEIKKVLEAKRKE